MQPNVIRITRIIFLLTAFRHIHNLIFLTVCKTKHDKMNNHISDWALFSHLAVQANRQPTSNDDVSRLLRETLNVPSPYKYVVPSQEIENITEHITFDPSSHVSHCPITMEDFATDEIISKLRCGHVFNQDALKNWLLSEKAECPVCRYKLPCVEVRNQDEQEQQSAISQPDPEEERERRNIDQNIIAFIGNLQSLNNLQRL